MGRIIKTNLSEYFENNIKNNPLGDTAVTVEAPKLVDALGSAALRDNQTVIPVTPENSGMSPTPSETNTPTTVEGNKIQPMSYEEYVLSLKSKADDAYKKSIIDAQNTYDQSKTTYGANAAALGSMGLTGSGYSQYLDSKAYAQRSADVNAAKAVRSDAYTQADAKYMDYINQKETEAKAEAQQKEANATNAYVSLYESILSDPTMYGMTDISNLGSIMGISPERITELQNYRNEKILAGGNYSKNDLLEMFGSEDDPKYQEYFKKIQDDADAIDASWFYEEDGTLKDKEISQNIINEIKNTGANTDKAQALLNNTYAAESIASNDVTFKRDTGIDGFTAGQKGNNIVLKDGDGNSYRVEFSGAEASPEVKRYAEAKGLKENDVFMYDNKVYVILNGKYYEVSKRTNSTGAWAGSWNNLIERLKSKSEE